MIHSLPARKTSHPLRWALLFSLGIALMPAPASLAAEAKARGSVIATEALRSRVAAPSAWSLAGKPVTASRSPARSSILREKGAHVGPLRLEPLSAPAPFPRSLPQFPGAPGS